MSENGRRRRRLTRREREVALLVSKGLPNKLIGAQLSITPGTVKVNLARIFVKTAVTNRTQLAVRVLNGEL